MPHTETPSPLGDCIDAVYQAARRAENWQSVLALLATIFPGTKWALASEQPKARRNIGFIWHGFEDDLIRDYVAHYASVNPWIPFATQFPVLRAFASDDHFPSYLFKNQEFYAGFIEAAGEAQSCATIKMYQNADRFAVLSVHYGSGMAEAYNRSIPRFLDALAPHLRNAVEINAELNETRPASATLAALIEHFEQPAFLLDGSGAVHRTNGPGEALLDARVFATKDESSRFRPTDPDAARRLDALLRARSRTETAAPLAPSTISDRWRFIDASLGTSDVPLAWLGGRGRWILALFDPRQAPETFEATIATRFGLTTRQREVAQALVAGYNLSEAAERMGVTKNTARQHLKGVFTKTGTHRQAELVTRLSRISRTTER